MKTRQLIKGLGGALVATVLVFSAPASADTQLIHFDDATNGWKWYSDVDRNFLFNPTNLQSGHCADSTSGGNGSCVIEQPQNVLPVMTRPTNDTELQGDSADPTWVEDITADPLVSAGGSGANLAFTLDSFYFLLTGRGEHQGNFITIEGGYGQDPDDDATAFSTALALGQSYANVTFYDPDNPGVAAGALDWNTGYIATFGDFFADVTWIRWSALSSAQLRLDCVVATFDGTTTEPYDPATSCGLDTPTNGVPEPGTVALLGLGLVGMGLMRRRRKV